MLGLLSGLVKWRPWSDPVDPDVVVEQTAHGTTIVGIDLPRGTALEKYQLPEANMNGWRLRIFARKSDVAVIRDRLAEAVRKLGELR